MTPSESQRQYPDVRHGWLCDGRLLRLTEPDAAGALRLFRDQWRRGQPVRGCNLGLPEQRSGVQQLSVQW